MDFTLTEEQNELRQLAATLVERVTPNRLEELEGTAENFDRALWSDLAQSGLLGVALPEEVDGLGLGLVAFALVCEELGRVVAPVPFVWTVAAALAISAYGTDEQKTRWLPGVTSGDIVLTCALPQSTVDVRLEGGRLTGTLVGVPYAHVGGPSAATDKPVVAAHATATTAIPTLLLIEPPSRRHTGRTE